MNSRKSLAQIAILTVSCALTLPAVVAADDSRARLPSPARDADFRRHPAELVELGRLLFFDKEQSIGDRQRQGHRM